MRQEHHRNFAVASVLSALAVLTVVLVLASSASAAYEQLPAPEGCFAGPCSSLTTKQQEELEEIQLGGVGSLAVNRTGAGGVPKGTVYAATRKAVGPGVHGVRVAMFVPKPGGGLKFVEGWAVTQLEGPYEVCGPEGSELPSGSKPGEHAKCPVRPNAEGGETGVDIDQSTGTVFVYGAFTFSEGGGEEVVAYSAGGGEVVARFAELAASTNETVAESPSKSHEAYSTDPIAVNSATGQVYLSDEHQPYHRLMVFGPDGSGGYEYEGEVAAGSDLKRRPHSPVFDDAGHLYVAGTGFGGDHVEQLPAEAPGSYPNPQAPAVCSYEYAKGGLNSMTVDPSTGDPFFSSEKKEGGKFFIRRLGACDPDTGTFALPGGTEPEAIAFSPQRGELAGLAFDPEREIEAARPPGVLYGGVAEPKAETSQSALGYVFAQPAERTPVVENESVTNVGASGAVLHATINPNGFPTTYSFQYLTQEAYEAAGNSFIGAAEAPLGGGTIRASEGVQNVAVVLTSLSPGTSYRFRVVVSSECAGPTEPLCEGAGEAESFHTYMPIGSTLPDDRAWELVSPAQKFGGQVLPADPGVTTCSFSCKPGITYSHFPMLSIPDGNTVAFEGTGFGLGGAAIENAYLATRDPLTGWHTTNPTPPLMSKAVGYRAYGADLGSAVIEQPNSRAPRLATEAPAGYANLYSQNMANPTVLTPMITTAPPHRSTGASDGFRLKFGAGSPDGSRVLFAANDTLTEAAPTAPAPEDAGASKDNLYEWHAGQLSLVNVLPGNGTTEAGGSFPRASANPISEDGSRVFWSDQSGQVYVRIGGTETLKVPDSASFLFAAKDGSRVLLADGVIYDIDSSESFDLTAGKGGFEGVVGQSDDLSHVYFVDSEVIDSSPNGSGEVAEAGAYNLYAWELGSGARFVARLNLSDNNGGALGGHDWAKVPAERTAEASPNGRFLAFISENKLTGYNNVGPCDSDHEGGWVSAPCPEVFIYDSAGGNLTCASCNPSESLPLGWSVLRRIAGGFDGPQPRYLTDSGRLFFDSTDSLSPLDTNEGKEDVYQYEPDGVGDCAEEAGCISLISAGREAEDSNFVAADETGANVFFTTRDRLVRPDTDELIDLYVAREGGGIAADTETQRTECQGEACQAPVSVPSDPTPGSSSFEGPGNVKEAKKKPKHHKKHHKKKHHRQAKHNRGAHR